MDSQVPGSLTWEESLHATGSWWSFILLPNPPLPPNQKSGSPATSLCCETLALSEISKKRPLALPLGPEFSLEPWLYGGVCLSVCLFALVVLLINFLPLAVYLSVLLSLPAPEVFHQGDM